ncbi:hypothetical protein [Labrys sp. (in: a-proteobacteria)]|uniref:hypothetical protein n=1 Tax=Labrys sp. (in: a-proteobacteria) TaxID=1917972 RepID=UPI0039E4A36D
MATSQKTPDEILEAIRQRRWADKRREASVELPDGHRSVRLGGAILGYRRHGSGRTLPKAPKIRDTGEGKPIPKGLRRAKRTRLQRLRDLDLLIEHLQGEPRWTTDDWERPARFAAHHLDPQQDEAFFGYISARFPLLPDAMIGQLQREAERRPILWSADRAAKYLGVTYAIRTELGLRTIGAIGVNRTARAKAAYQRKNAGRCTRAAAERRAKGTPTREEWTQGSLRSLAPWEYLGRSKRWFFYLSLPQRESVIAYVLAAGWKGPGSMKPVAKVMQKEAAKIAVGGTLGAEFAPNVSPQNAPEKQLQKLHFAPNVSPPTLPKEGGSLPTSGAKSLASATPVFCAAGLGGDGQLPQTSSGPPGIEKGGGPRPPPVGVAGAVGAAGSKSKVIASRNMRLSPEEVTPVPLAPPVTSVGAPEGAPDAVVADGDGGEVEALPAPLDFTVTFQHADTLGDFVIGQCHHAETAAGDDLDDDGDDLTIARAPCDLTASPAPQGASGDGPEDDWDQRDLSACLDRDGCGADLDVSLSNCAARIGLDQEDSTLTLNELHGAALNLPRHQRHRLYQLLDLPAAMDDLSALLILAQTTMSDEQVVTILAKRAANRVEGPAWPAAAR